MKVWAFAGCALLALASSVGCSGEGEPTKPAPGSDAGAGGEALQPGEGGSNEGGSGTGDEPSLEAPVAEAALLTFLEEEQYTAWPKEAAIHPSAGPHGEEVRVYYSPKAAAALARGATTLPAGAASVKELSSGGKLYGYSVWVKVQDEADAGNGFFWYEVMDRGGTRNVYGNSLGSRDCVGCHAAGVDYSLSTLPFE